MITPAERDVPPTLCGDEALSVQFLHDEEALEGLEGEWTGLFEACERPSPCASHAWTSAWWQAYGGNAHGAGEETKPLLLLFRNAEGTLVGIAPFVEDRPSGPLRVRRLRMMGQAWRCGVFDMTEEPSLLVRASWEDRVLALLASELKAGLASGRWDAVSVRTHGVALHDAFRGIGLVKADARAGSDYAVLPGSWAAYRKAMTRSMRDNLAYYPRLLTRDGHDWHVRLLRAPEAMPDAAARLARLHRARAGSDKGRRHDAHLQGPVQDAFLSGLLRRLAAQGRATVAELVVGGEVVASQAFVEADDTLMVYYSGYLDAWYRYSPIFVIDAVVFKDALERGIRRLDFLRSPAPWKTRWLAEPGPKLHRAVLISRRPEGLLRYGIFWADQIVRRNVVQRMPILTRRLAAGYREWRTTFERAILPAIPLTMRLGTRMAPTVHWALVQAPLHHR